MEQFRRRIEKHSVPVPECGCWIWEGSLSVQGYGQVRINKRLLRAHRVSYEGYVGEIPHGMQVCHRCDTPSCVNPAHLFLGTHADNHRDKVAKGRQWRPTGEKHHRVRLTESQVLEIRKNPEVPMQAFAERFGVNVGTIWFVRQGLTWKHLKDSIVESSCGV